VDQRDRQPDVRLPCVRGRRRLHLGPEQPREPAHGLVERRRARSARRHVLRSRRGQRGDLRSDAAADPRRPRPVRGSTRAGLQHLRARHGRLRPAPFGVRRARRRREDLEARVENRSANLPPPSPPMPSGCWDRRAPRPPHTGDGRAIWTRARSWRGTRGATSSAAASRSRTWSDGRGPGRPIAASSSAATARPTTRSRWRSALASRGAPAPDSTRARRCRRRSSCDRARRRRSSSCSAKARRATRRAA
jgi:hypothetical protein